MARQRVPKLSAALPRAAGRLPAGTRRNAAKPLILSPLADQQLGLVPGAKNRNMFPKTLESAGHVKEMFATFKADILSDYKEGLREASEQIEQARLSRELLT